MQIYLASYQSLLLNKGGPTYKIMSLHKALQERGLDVRLFDMWHPFQKSEKKIFHLFNAGIAMYSLAQNLDVLGAKYLVNPIFFSNHSTTLLRGYQMLDKVAHSFLKRSYSDYSITRSICEKAARVLPNTMAESRLLQKSLQIDPRKIQVIENGVEARFAHADPSFFQKKYHLQDFVLYVGHLGPDRKNGRRIIKALQKLDHPSVIIADVLHNAEGELCRREINRSKNILLIEWLDHDDPLFASAYAACDTFILPTKYETPGRAALEAGLAGAKIVITPKGGTKEYFLDLALYPDPLSENSILQQVENSLNRKKNNDLKDHILKNYIWEVIAEKTEKIYHQVLNNE